MIFNAVVAAATFLLPGLATAAAASVYDRPLAFVYATKGGKGLPQYSDKTLLDHFAQVKPGITSLPAFLLNVEDPMQYEPMIRGLQKMNIVMIPAIGGPPTNDILTSDFNKGVARGYRNFTDYVRLETGLGYIQEHGIQSIQDMIDYCVKTLGFKHVMLNPWPEQNGVAVHFPNPEVEATFDNVLYPSGNTDWYPGNQNKIKAVHDYRPSASVLINYESPGQQQALVELEKKKKGASTQAMQITLDQINGQYKAENLHWCPPLGRSYDAIGLGTWDWIAAKLSKQ